MKTALVLAGGGGKGAFQFTAEKYAREHGFKWDIISGVSVGALNATMLAMEKYERLEDLWKNITRNQVYKANLLTYLNAFLGRSIYNNKPLQKLLEKEYEPEKIKINLRVGSVSLNTGEYKIFTPKDKNFLKAVIASTAIPILWEPVNVSDKYPNMVDGGVRTLSPLGDVLDLNPDQVIIINCDTGKLEVTDKLNNILDIGKRSLQIMMNEIFQTDLREFIRINHNVKEAAKKGVKLHNENGKVYKYYDYKIIEPDEPMGDTLDFSKEIMEKRMKAGWEKAKEVLTIQQ